MRFTIYQMINQSSKLNYAQVSNGFPWQSCLFMVGMSSLAVHTIARITVVQHCHLRTL